MYRLKLFHLILVFASVSIAEASNEPFSSSGSESEGEYYTLRVLTYNIYHGETNKLDGVIDMDLFGQIIKDFSPDLVALQEVDKKTKRVKGLDLTEELSKRTGLDGYFCKFRDYQGGEYGTAILSRFPVVELELKDAFLPESGALKTLPFAKVEIDEDTYIYFNSSHLSLAFEERKIQIEQIVSYYEKELNLAPLIVSGDLNTEPDSEEMQVLLEKFSIADTTLSHTFSTRTGLVKKIDYILYPSNDNWEVVETQTACREDASDHCALFVILRFKKP